MKRTINDTLTPIRRLLVFEFIVGGGFSQQLLPESLAKEGELMLKTLVDELALLADLEITVFIDWRFESLVLSGNVNKIVVSSQQSVFELLSEYVERFDYVWPIAPEMESILQEISVLIEEKNSHLLNSSAKAVAVCSDKWATYRRLKSNKVSVVESYQLQQFDEKIDLPWVIKQRDGVGCINNYLISTQSEFDTVNSQINKKSDYLLQPYIKGQSLSLSCLFNKGEGWIICCNQQQISVKQGRFELKACLVNIDTLNGIQQYQQLVDQVAHAIPGLWGYVGIDIIQPEFAEPLVLEINPRLTTSYVGIYQALGFNVAKAVINLIDGDPVIKKTFNHQIDVNLS
ncbi:MAG: ATP-grasp domain-containing protein [Methylococcales bacterium]|nr:ATP-grasp domain-containing protein [Methylococcales bacterium]